ncbi:MAG: molybdopterin-dependent oxidoreductase, partial [Ilumatobacteraceae bacterium]
MAVSLDRRSAALSGVVAAGVALGVGELVTSVVGSGPTLVESVGTEFIDRYAASLKDLAVRLFGQNDKAALIVGIIVVSLLLGAVLGRAAARRRWVGVAGIAVFGIVGSLAYASDPQGNAGTGIVAAVLAVAAGSATLLVLLHLAGARHDGATTTGAEPRSSRRTFVVAAGVLAAGAAGAVIVG